MHIKAQLGPLAAENVEPWVLVKGFCYLTCLVRYVLYVALSHRQIENLQASSEDVKKPQLLKVLMSDSVWHVPQCAATSNRRMVDFYSKSRLPS